MRNKTIQGDSNTVLATVPEGSVDLVVTDPPYLVNYRDRDGRRVRNDDAPGAVLPVFDQVYRVLKPNTYCLSFCGWTAIHAFAGAWHRAGFRIVGHIVWTKPYTSGQSHTAYRHEQAYVLVKGRPQRPGQVLDDVQPWVYSGNRAHPTEKAVDVIAPLIRSFSKPGDLVLDPFLGSGTTAVAAALCGRDYLGIELEPRHAATARKRLEGVARFQEGRKPVRVAA